MIDKIIGLNNIKKELLNLKEIPNILFIGARGTGKTTLAKAIAEYKKLNLVFLTGNNLKKIELLNSLIQLEENSILLIDEIHRLRPDVEEVLYHPLENKQLVIKAVNGNFQVIDLPKNISFIGTTTKPSLISKPLLSRFQLVIHIPHYNLRNLARIIKLNFPNFNNKEALQIAINITTPREAINLAYRINQLKNSGLSVNKALEFIGYKFGLSNSEREYLKILFLNHKMSQSSLASALQVDKDELKFIEDSLIRKRLITITSKGRELTIKGLMVSKKL